MSKIRIFLSSTCYDLAPVREGIRDHIISLGHEPVLSEYPSFPISPDHSTIDICRKNIQEGTDILVLIVGGRRGSLDPATKKSVTNLEYETARSLGIPCFIFINRSVQTLYNVWQKNPDADFTPAVDHTEVFSFIDRIFKESKWTFTFERVAEIKDLLSIQLSVFFRDLLSRHRTGSLEPVPEFGSESPEAKRIARDKPSYWEFLLTAELLKTKLAQIRVQHDRVQGNLSYKPSRLFGGQEFLNFTNEKMDDLLALVEAMRLQVAEVTKSWGPLGVPGNALDILRTCNELAAFCHQLVEWESDLLSATPPTAMNDLRSLMRGWTGQLLSEMERLPAELTKPFENGAQPEGRFHIELSFESPPVEGFRQELKRLSKNPRLWM